MSKRGGFSGFSRLLLLCGAVACSTFPVRAAWAATHGFKSLYSFQTGSDGANPYSPLLYGPDGNFYGTTNAGGAAGAGTVFRLKPNGAEKVLYAFKGNPDGAGPGSSGLVADAGGNLYGTTQLGGKYGDGTIFRIAAGGGETVLYSFTGGSDGSVPNATLIIDSAGNLYGTASGGAGNAGVVFEYTSGGAFNLLHTFFGGGADGTAPEGALLRDGSGNLFGTTSYGGADSKGTVYEIAANGTEQVLYTFTGGADGAHPNAGVIEDSAGNLYGTATDGGADSYGTVYKLSPNGSLEVLHAFTSGDDGAYPYGALVRDSGGNLYGTTEYGGPIYGEGTVFQIAPKGKETVFHSFVRSDGANPTDTLISVQRASGVMLYGTTVYGGANNRGSVFVLKQ